jgi:hypothetical protein
MKCIFFGGRCIGDGEVGITFLSLGKGEWWGWIRGINGNWMMSFFKVGTRLY